MSFIAVVAVLVIGALAGGYIAALVCARSTAGRLCIEHRDEVEHRHVIEHHHLLHDPYSGPQPAVTVLSEPLRQLPSTYRVR